MSMLSLLLLGTLAWGSELTQKASQQLSEYRFKEALTSWKEIYQKTPHSLDAALRVSELQLLLEGRNAALDTLKAFQKKNRNNLSNSQKQEINEKLLEWNEMFLVEEAQINYLQALSKSELKKWSEGIHPITQAVALEPGNTKILSLKAEIEKQTGNISAYLNTLGNLQKTLPESEKLTDKVVEALVYQQQYAEVEKLLSKKDFLQLSLRSRVALIVSLWEMGKKEEADKLLSDLIRNRKSGPHSHPALSWMLARTRKDELRAFLDLGEHPQQLKVDGWDPYRLQEQVKTLTQ